MDYNPKSVRIWLRIFCESLIIKGSTGHCSFEIGPRKDTFYMTKRVFLNNQIIQKDFLYLFSGQFLKYNDMWRVMYICSYD